MVPESIESLNRFGNKSVVTLHWIKAHAKHFGNEKVDQLAKYGASSHLVSLEPYLPIPQSVGDNSLKTFLDLKWQQQWQSAVT
jgi:hypothetical protein